MDEELPLTQDGYEDTMPNYHEDLEDDSNQGVPGEDIVDADESSVTHGSELATRPEFLAGSSKLHEVNTPTSGPLKPQSIRAKSIKPPSASSASTKPLSRNRPSSVSHGDSVYVQTCPVCSKTFETDNQGLNAHVDFCLSKGAILEAQSAASAGGSVKLTLKPDSSTSRKAPSKPNKRRKG